MAKFRKKPVVIEAMQWLGPSSTDGPSVDDVQAWGCAVEPTGTWGSLIDGEGVDYTLVIPTLEGNMICGVGDWIIKGVKGEFYPCKPDIFEATYESVDVSDAPAGTAGEAETPEAHAYSRGFTDGCDMKDSDADWHAHLPHARRDGGD